MDIWQRGTSFSGIAGGSYTADRWYAYRGLSATGYTTSRQVTGDTTNLPNIQYCARLQRNSGDTSTASLALTQSFETANSIPFAGKTVTLSFYARKGANFSAASSLFEADIYYGTGTDQAVYNGYTGVGAIGTNTLVATTTWQRFTYTGTLPATATEIAPYFIYNPTGTAGAADYLEITGVQIDIGSVALPYRKATSTLQGELAAAQRYYFRTYDVTQPYMHCFCYNGTSIQFNYRLPVTMRTTPSSMDYSNINIQDISSGTVYSASGAPSLNSANPDNAFVIWTTFSGLTTYRPYNIIGNGTLGYLGFSAEL
jgi:hypothetical protein